MNKDPRLIITESDMTIRQWIVVGLTIALNALDGFDVLSISFAAPGIAANWGIDRAALGVVLSMELIGMAAGSILLGGLADRFGRRPVILGCLLVMSFGMFLAGQAQSIALLSFWRLLTGLGIGGMLAALNAVTAEFTNHKRRNLCLALMVIGYPIGAVLGGSVAAYLLTIYDWRAVFTFGAIVTASFLVLVWFLLPETVAFLCQRRPRHALDKINNTLRRMKLATATALPVMRKDEEEASIADIFKGSMARITILVTMAYFAHITTFYFILKWAPKIVADMGFAASSAAGVLVWANVGGAAGGAFFGVLAQRFGLKPLTIIVLAGSFFMVTAFGSGQASLQTLALMAGLAGLFTNAAVVGLYSIFAHAFPTHVRATGTGFAIGVGRGGAAISPIVAGLLFEFGLGLQWVAVAMAAGSIIAILSLWTLKLDERRAMPGG